MAGAMSGRPVRGAVLCVLLAWMISGAAGCQDRPDGPANVTAGSRMAKGATPGASMDQPEQKPARPEDGAGGPEAAKPKTPEKLPEKPRPKEVPAAKPKDAPAPKPEVKKNPLAGCQQCHVDIEDEFMPSVHFEEKVACTECHGPSKGHLADENNEVKPDEIFARKDVDRLCERCHECERPADPKPVPSSSPGYKVCIDCHGPHDLARKEPAPAGKAEGAKK